MKALAFSQICANASTALGSL